MRASTSAAARRRRRHLGFAVVLALLGSLLLAPEALANFFTPKSGGSPNANAIDSLYKIILYLAAFVFVVVEGALVYSVYKFRAKKGAVASQIHGNTRLEIGWTVAAALILVVITVVTFIKLPSIINPPNSNGQSFLSASLDQPTPPNKQALHVCVSARQYIFRFNYGSDCKNGAFSNKSPYTYTEMVVPVGVTVILSLQSSDVIHSWWVPSLGGKVDVVPGYTTYTWFKVTHPGLYHGQCAQLCGRGHAAMIIQVLAVSPSDYKAWYTRQQHLIAAQNAQVSQLRQLLTQNGNL